MSAQLREASSVILLRRVGGEDDAGGGPASGAAAKLQDGHRGPEGFEVFLVRRRRSASFMASAFVFPGGAADPGEDARTAAARELFEEAGVLLARDAGGSEGETLEMPTLGGMRKRILDGANAAEVLAGAGLTWSTDMLVPWSHWITPSIEPKRFSARFFLCELPTGQVPSFDDVETVEEIWVSPAEALARAGELALPPPQVRTFWELAELPTLEAVIAAGRARAEEPHPIMPRLKQGGAGGPCLLLPWDPEYVDGGTGDSTPLTYRPRWARGPSRFVMEDRAWKHIAAPGSTSAG